MIKIWEKIEKFIMKKSGSCYLNPLINAITESETPLCVSLGDVIEVHSLTDGVLLSKRQNIKPESNEVFRYTFH